MRDGLQKLESVFSVTLRRIHRRGTVVKFLAGVFLVEVAQVIGNPYTLHGQCAVAADGGEGYLCLERRAAGSACSS